MVSIFAFLDIKNQRLYNIQISHYLSSYMSYNYTNSYTSSLICRKFKRMCTELPLDIAHVNEVIVYSNKVLYISFRKKTTLVSTLHLIYSLNRTVTILKKILTTSYNIRAEIGPPNI